MATQRETVITTETEWLTAQQHQERRVDLVVTDAAFAPLVAASQLNIPSVVVSNFTWDSIYSDYLPKEILSAITSDYSHASWVLRLPGKSPFPLSSLFLFL